MVQNNVKIYPLVPVFVSPAQVFARDTASLIVAVSADVAQSEKYKLKKENTLFTENRAFSLST